MIRTLGGLALALGASGCAAVPEQTSRDLGLVLPDAFTAAETADTAPPDSWWRTFEDPSLAEIVEEALVHNRDLYAAAARLDAAIARAGAAGSELWPQLSAGANLRRNRQNFIGLPIPGGGDVLSVTNNQFGLSLDLGWELDLWGRVRAGQIAADSDLEAAVADLRGARLSLAARATQGWFAAVEASQQLRLAEDTADSLRRTEELVRRRYETGVRSAFDLRLARSDRDEAEALVEVRRRQRDEVLRQLEILLGRYPARALDPGVDLPDLPAPVPAGLPSGLLRRRPDLVAAERRLAAADARLAEARADLYPRLSLTASGGTSSNDLQDLGDLDFMVWSIGANLLAPILDGGRRRAVVDLQDAGRREAAANFASAVLDALREVETALAAAAILGAEEGRRTAAVEEAEAALRLSEERYASGLLDINTLLATQRRALAARTQLIAVRRQLLDNRVELLLALGGGFDAAVDGEVLAEPLP
jgi:NodT family efflux transporter outer membrane factor (OMF) lipoprotein